LREFQSTRRRRSLRVRKAGQYHSPRICPKPQRAPARLRFQSTDKRREWWQDRRPALTPRCIAWYSDRTRRKQTQSALVANPKSRSGSMKATLDH
jgi:hypothetical protein